jgi:uncharacterized protein (TIGR02246 family)
LIVGNGTVNSRIVRWPVPVIAAALALSAVAARAAPADDAQIRALEDRLVAAVAAKDTDAVMGLYVSDDSIFVFDAPPPQEIVGTAAWRRNVQGFFDLFDGPVNVRLSDLGIDASGDMAYSHSIQRFTGKTTKGAPVDLTLRVTDVYRKMKGKWLIVHEHVSAPIDLDTGKADLSSKS